VQCLLEELPECLDTAYDRVLEGKTKKNQRIAHRLMQCLVVAIRPLRIEELADVFAVDFDVEGTPMLNPDWRWVDQEEAVMSACPGLVAIINDGDSRIVQFSHFTVKEYLMSDRLVEPSREVSCYHIQLESAHTILAQACLGTLLRFNADRDSIESFPLARYAAQYWVEHAQFGNVASRIEDGMDCLFDADKPHFSTWLGIYDEDAHSSTPRRRSSQPKHVPLYYSGLFGFRDLAKRLLEKHPEDIYARGGYHGTPLHAAASAGHVDVSSLLIDQLPVEDIDIRGIRNQTSLHRAARQGHSEIGQRLINRGADVDARDKSDWTPLHSAAMYGHVEFARMLLDHKATVTAADECGRCPLHLASIRGQVEVVQLLLKHGANPHARDSSGSTPGEIASSSGHRNEKTVQLLSEYGAEAVHK
jgi:ankyrin repeat protein